MTTATKTRQNTKDFTQFYNEWHQVVSNAVYRAGFRDHDAQDLIQDIFADLYSGGYLDKYDAEQGAFSTYIWGHVNIRIKDRKRSFWKRSQREFIPKPIIDDEGTEITFETADPDNSDMENTELSITVDHICKELDKLPATKSKNLARLFRDIVKQVTEKGEFSQTELARAYGCSRQAISYQVADLARTDAVKVLKELV